MESRRLIAARVSEAMGEGFSPVIVVSAMGRAGDPYSTDTLIALAKSEYTSSDAREIDLIMSCGEVISSVLVCNALKAHGLKATAIAGGQIGIITDDMYNNATIRDVDPRPILDRLEAGRVVVVAGFQGTSRSGDITTLGRGGSDTSAVALGVALKAELVEIYKDVDGIKTADPRVVPAARTISQLTYDETFHMANEGARVIHPRAVEIARRYDMPIRVRSAFDGSPGTLVARDKACWSEAGAARPVTGVTHVRGLSRVSVSHLQNSPVSHTRIFRSLADAGVSIDMISVMPEVCSFVVSQELADRATTIITEIGVQPEVARDCAKVSIVGWGIQDLPGIMASVSEALQDAGVDILQTSDSHVTISCLIRSTDLETSARALHRRFGLDISDSERRK
jgi:aspartate kinase